MRTRRQRCRYWYKWPVRPPLIKLYILDFLSINEHAKSTQRPCKWAGTGAVLKCYVSILTQVLLLFSHSTKLIILEFLSPTPTQEVTVPSLRISLMCVGVKIHTQRISLLLRDH